MMSSRWDEEIHSSSFNPSAHKASTEPVDSVVNTGLRFPGNLKIDPSVHRKSVNRSFNQ